MYTNIFHWLIFQQLKFFHQYSGHLENSTCTNKLCLSHTNPLQSPTLINTAYSQVYIYIPQKLPPTLIWPNKQFICHTCLQTSHYCLSISGSAFHKCQSCSINELDLHSWPKNHNSVWERKWPYYGGLSMQSQNVLPR